MSESIVKVVGVSTPNPRILTLEGYRGDGLLDTIRLKDVGPDGNTERQVKVYKAQSIPGCLEKQRYIDRIYKDSDIAVTQPVRTHKNPMLEYPAKVYAGRQPILDVCIKDGEVCRINHIDAKAIKEMNLPNSAKRLLRLAGDFLKKIR